MKLPNDEIVHYKSDDGVTCIVERTELVRCKDCKYQPQAVRRWDDNDTIATYVWCEEMYCADRDNFCPYGKKDGDEE